VRPRDFWCPELRAPVDYLQIQGWAGAVAYEVPRKCVEALGIRTLDIPPNGRGPTIWFTREQAERLRSHKHAVFAAPESIGGPTREER